MNDWENCDSAGPVMYGPPNIKFDPVNFGTLGISTAEIDPNGVGQHEPGAKLDAGKPDASLLKDFGLALMEVAKVSTVGAKKYSRGGWQFVDDGHNRYTAAMLRHFFQERLEDIDEDTQMLHMAQTAWNALARLELYLREG